MLLILSKISATVANDMGFFRTIMLPLFMMRIRAKDRATVTYDVIFFIG